MLTGKKVWVMGSVDTENGPMQYFGGPYVVTKFKQFLPAGQTKHGERKLSLVQFFSDFGERTVSVASLWTKDPRSAQNPW